MLDKRGSPEFNTEPCALTMPAVYVKPESEVEEEDKLRLKLHQVLLKKQNEVENKQKSVMRAPHIVENQAD